MFKKLLTFIISMVLAFSLIACGGTTTIKIINDDEGSQMVVLETLRLQLQNVSPITDYDGNTPIEQMNTITFGLDENSQPIEWLVLEKNNNKALLISKYILTKHLYNDKKVDITWEKCTMRRWLNSEYINNIFSKKEQDSILTTDIITRDIAPYRTKGGKNTKDKLFLLSFDEALEYFNFSKSQRVAIFKDDSSYEWWLRSPSINQSTVMYVISNGSCAGIGSVNLVLGVRPAMWVKY